MKALALDIGRQCIRFGIVDESWKLERCAQFETGSEGFESALDKILCRYDLTRKRLAETALVIAAPGPFRDGEFSPLAMPGWQLSVSDLRAGVTRGTEIIHDVVAGAYGIVRQTNLQHVIPMLEFPVHSEDGKNARAFIQTGVGLGASVLLPKAPDARDSISGEAGSATIAPYPDCEDERRVFDHFGNNVGRWGFRSAQALLSIDSLPLYSAPLGGDYGDIPGMEIVERARAQDPAACRALAVYAGFLGTFAGDIALAYRAYDGVLIAGLAPLSLNEAGAWGKLIRNFRERGPAGEQLAGIALMIITDEYHSLKGLAEWLQCRHGRQN
jgi:glucokinase